MKNSQYVDSQIIAKNHDCDRIPPEQLDVIAKHLEPHQFSVKEVDSHIVIETRIADSTDWQCGYLFQEGGSWVWLTAKKRWWLLLLTGDPDDRCELLSRLIPEALELLNLELLGKKWGTPS